MTAFKRVAKNTGILYIRMAVTIFISLYFTRLILGTLGAEDFGIYNLVAGMVAMLVFLNAAMAAASQRFMSYAQGEGNEEKQKNIFNVSLILHLAIAILVAVLIECVGYFLFDSVLDIPLERMEAAKIVFHFMVMSTFLTIVSVPYDAVINAHENMLFLAILSVLEAILKLFIALYITYGNVAFDKLIAFGFLIAMSAIVSLFIKLIYCHKSYKEVIINIRTYFKVSLLKEMGGFASWSFLGTATGVLSFYGQGIVLNIFFGPIINAAQAIAAQVNGQLSAFSSTMMQALNPMIVKSEGEGNRGLMLKASLLGSKLSFFLLMVFCVPIMLEMATVFKLWLGETPAYTIVFCQLLLVKTLIYQLVLPLATSIRAVGNIKNYEIIKSCISVFPLIVDYLLFSQGCPAYFLYIVFIVEAIFLSIITLYFCKAHCSLNPKKYALNVIFRCLSSFFIVFTLVKCISFFIENDLFRLMIVMISSFTAFLLVVYLVGFDKEERLGITNIIVKLYNGKLKNKENDLNYKLSTSVKVKT